MKLTLRLLLSIILFSITINASENAPTKEEVSKLYVATFNRAPDSAGLLYWLNTGDPLLKIASDFFLNSETQELYPQGTSDESFINSVYQNLFNRSPDAGGMAYWKEDLKKPGHKREEFILLVIGGAKDNADGMDKTILNNKNEVGLYFANAGLGNDDFPTVVMSGVTENIVTVSYIECKILHNYLSTNTWNFFTGSSSSCPSVLLKTGQTTSYTTYDDGYYQTGITPNYTRAGNIVTDHITGLQWQDDSNAKTVTKTWEEAKTYCEAKMLDGYSGWRLPTRKELVGISDYGRGFPAINSTFLNTTSDGYWSSTIYAFDTSSAWNVYFSYGGQYYVNKTYNSDVRCVRVGQ